MLKKNQELNDDLEIKVSSAANSNKASVSTPQTVADDDQVSIVKVEKKSESNVSVNSPITQPESDNQPSAKQINRQIGHDDKVKVSIPAISTQIKTQLPNEKVGFTFSYILKYIICAIPTIITAFLLGKGLNIILGNPLFFLDFDLQHLLLLAASFILFLSFLYLVGVFFYRSYLLLFISAVIFAIAIVIGSSFTSNIFLMLGFAFGMFLVLVLFFIKTETDISNQFSFKFFQSLRSSHSFITWFTICVSAIFGLGLISTLGNSNYSISDPIVDNILGFIPETGINGINLGSFNQTIQDASKQGIDLGIISKMDPTASEMLFTPKEFIKARLNEYIKANSIAATLIITLLTFFAASFVFNTIAFIAKFASYAIFKLLGLVNFFAIEKVQKEANVLKVN